MPREPEAQAAAAAAVATRSTSQPAASRWIGKLIQMRRSSIRSIDGARAHSLIYSHTGWLADWLTLWALLFYYSHDRNIVEERRLASRP